MSKLKKYALILLIALSVDIIVPSINAMATVTGNNKESTESLNQNENFTIIENNESVEVSSDLNNEITSENENQNNKSIIEEISNDTVKTYMETYEQVKDSVIEGELENPTTSHRLTGDFFVKGFFVSTDTISKVEIFIDNKKVGDAKYGMPREDIASKYSYPNSLNSGFEFAVRGVSDGNHTIKVVATNNKGVTKENSANIVVNNNKNSIMGIGKLKREQMANFLHKNNLEKPMSYILNFVDLIISEAALEGVNHDILFSQIMNETGYLKFTGDVKEEQNNFAGIGATGNGNPGNSFPSIQIGIRAVVQHLKAYASSEPLKMELVDPRFNYVQRESAIYVEHLGIKENPNYKGWASAKEYGYRLLALKDAVSNETSTLQYSYLTDFKVSGEPKVGNKLTISSKSNMVSGTMYKIEVLKSNSNTWVTLSDWNSKNTVEYVPEYSGKHIFKVSIKSNNSSVDDYKTLEVNVVGYKSAVTSLEVTGNKYTGSTLTMTAKGTPETDTLYKLWVCDRSTNTWTVLSDWSTKNTITYVPKKAGNYTFTVHVKHKSNSSNVEDDYKSTDVVVTDPVVQVSKVESLSVTGNKYAGSTLTMTAKGTPEANTLYKLWVCDRSTNTWTVLSDWSTKNTITYVPKKAGNYTFTVHVKNKYSNNKDEDDYRSTDVVVANSVSKVSSLSVTGNKYAGSTLTMTAKGTPETDTLYKLWVCDRSTNTWTVLSDWSTKNTITYVPKKAGNYTFTVHVKNKYSNNKDEDDYRSTDVVVANSVSKVSSLSVTGNKYAGSTLTMTAKGTPETDTLYKLWVCDRSTNTWTVLSDWSTKNTITYVPKKAGNYTFTVHVKNKYSNNKDEDDYRSTDIVVANPVSLVSKVSSLSVTGNKYAGSTLTMTAKGTPETDTLYKLWVCDRSTNTWTVLSDWSTKNTITYVPKKAGNYTFTVHVKHKNSNNKDEDDYRSIDVVVANSVSKVSSLSVTGNKYVGSTLTMTAKGTPETDTLYKLWVCDRSTNTWTVLSDWSTKNTITYVPKKAGNYTFTVHVKNKYSNNKDEDDYRSTDVVVANSVSKVESINVIGDKILGNSLTLQAKANPTDNTLYKLWICDRSTNTWTVLSDWSTKSSINYTPTKIGKYTFTVHVKNKFNSSNIEEDYKSVDFYVTKKNESMVVSLDIKGEAKKGNTLTIEALAAPQSDTLYKIWVCNRKTGVWTVLSDWSSTRSVNYKIPEDSTYTFTVHVKHKNSINSNEDDYLSKDIIVKDKLLIVIDPGHNHGGDYGAVSTINGKKYEETELNMQVADLLKKELINRGYSVVMTREVGDKLYDELRPSLQKRVDLANRINADLFVSIHHNTNPNSQANGVEVYYSSEKPESGTANSNKVTISKRLAEAMVNNLSNSVGQYNRGAKDDSFYVVKNTLMPSVLVETGFISNPEEVSKITQPATQKLIATQLANSIDSIFKN